MKAEVKTQWVKALRSGEFPQGREALSDGLSYCCLGVLCEVAMREGVEVHREYDPGLGFVTYNGAVDILPETVAEWAGLDSVAPSVRTFDPHFERVKNVGLARLNDTFRTPFATLASLIEEQL